MAAEEIKGIAQEEYGDQFKAVLTNFSQSITEAMDCWKKSLDRIESAVEKVEKVCNQISGGESKEHIVDQPAPTERRSRRKWGKVIIETAYKWLGVTKENTGWLKDMRGGLSMVASIIATMTFQVGLNPPGGVVQNFEKGVVDCLNATMEQTVKNQSHACPGESVFGASDEDNFFIFMFFNSIAFYSSLIVCLWLISGLPLHHRFPTWLLALLMCVSLTSLAITYSVGVAMITPGSDDNFYAMVTDISSEGLESSFVLALVITTIFLARFILLLVSIICTWQSKKGVKTQQHQVTRLQSIAQR